MNLGVLGVSTKGRQFRGCAEKGHFGTFCKNPILAILGFRGSRNVRLGGPLEIRTFMVGGSPEPVKTRPPKTALFRVSL